MKVYLSDQDAEAAGFRTIVMGPAQDGASLVPFPGFGVGFMESVSFEVRYELSTAVAGGPGMSPDFHDGWRAQVVVESVLESAQKGWVSVPPVSEHGTGIRAPKPGTVTDAL